VCSNSNSDGGTGSTGVDLAFRESVLANGKKGPGGHASWKILGRKKNGGGVFFPWSGCCVQPFRGVLDRIKERKERYCISKDAGGTGARGK